MKEKEPEEENIPMQMLESEGQSGTGSTCP